MSMPPYPGPDAPLDPATGIPLNYQTPTGPWRPTSVTVLAIIGIVLGAYAVLCTPLSLLGAMFSSTTSTFTVTPTTGPATTTTTTTTTIVGPSTIVTIWTIASGLIAIALAIALLTGSIGSLMLRRWARPLMIVYAIATIVIGLLSLVVNILVVVPDTTRQLAGAGMPVPVGPIMIGAMVLGALIGLIYPVFVLIYFRKPNVVEAFNRGAALG